MQAGVLLALFFALNVMRNVSQTFEELEAKRSVITHHVKVTHPLFISITGPCALTIVRSVFFVRAGLIVEMLFMLFSIYNTV